MRLWCWRASMGAALLVQLGNSSTRHTPAFSSLLMKPQTRGVTAVQKSYVEYDTTPDTSFVVAHDGMDTDDLMDDATFVVGAPEVTDNHSFADESSKLSTDRAKDLRKTASDAAMDTSRLDRSSPKNALDALDDKQQSSTDKKAQQQKKASPEDAFRLKKANTTVYFTTPRDPLKICSPTCIKGRGVCADHKCFCRKPYSGKRCENVVDSSIRVRWALALGLLALAAFLGSVLAMYFSEDIRDYLSPRQSAFFKNQISLQTEVWRKDINKGIARSRSVKMNSARYNRRSDQDKK